MEFIPDRQDVDEVPAPDVPDAAALVAPLSEDGFAAQMAHLACADEVFITQILDRIGARNFTQLTHSTFERTSTMGFGFVLKGRAWIVYRGLDDLDDWASNLLFIPYFHIGFRKNWNAIRDETYAFVQMVADDVTGFSITGHSIGGAIGTLAAMDLAEAGFEIESVVTFGSPRVGSPNFAQAFDELPANDRGETLGNITRRYSTGEEKASKLPFEFLGFKHVGREVVLHPDNSAGRWPTLQDPRIVAAQRIGRDVGTTAMLPILILKALAFGLDREADQKMAAYLEFFDEAEPLINIESVSSERHSSVWFSSPSSALFLLVLASLGIWALGSLAWASLSVAVLSPIALVMWSALLIYTMRQRL